MERNGRLYYEKGEPALRLQAAPIDAKPEADEIFEALRKVAASVVARAYTVLVDASLLSFKRNFGREMNLTFHRDREELICKDLLSVWQHCQTDSDARVDE